jgi:hypothetical protein
MNSSIQATGTHSRANGKQPKSNTALPFGKHLEPHALMMIADMRFLQKQLPGCRHLLNHTYHNSGPCHGFKRAESAEPIVSTWLSCLTERSPVQDVPQKTIFTLLGAAS